MIAKLILFLIIWITRTKSQTIFRLEGELNAEDYRYYKILQPGNLLLLVESIDGDADVYVSEKNPTPTFDPESYDLQSATCGEDQIYLSKNMKRPIHVGIYGHFSHNRSRYALEVLEMPETENHFRNNDPSSLPDRSASENDNTAAVDEHPNSERREIKRSPKSSKRRNSKNLSNSLWPFLELFEILFL